MWRERGSQNDEKSAWFALDEADPNYDSADDAFLEEFVYIGMDS